MIKLEQVIEHMKGSRTMLEEFLQNNTKVEESNKKIFLKQNFSFPYRSNTIRRINEDN